MAYGAVTVSTGTKIVSANPNRIGLIITNTDSSVKLYLGDDASVTASNGIEIPAGGSFTEDSGGTKMFCADIYGSAGSGSINVRYWERTRQG
jgi:hypothetical protein